MKKSLWVLILSLLLSVASGQGTLRVRGKIVNEHGYQPLVGANLIVTCLDDSSQYYATSDQTGRYDIRNLKPGKYNLKITYIGFHELVRKFEINNRNEDLGNNLLSFAAIQMGPVNVEKARPLATQKGDTTQYSADSYKTAPDASAEDLVAKMPGITLESGQVKAQGETVKKVLVDNRPFFGDDPNAALRNLPAEIVEKIQVFDQQSEQAQMTGFDDGNTSKTMNIVTREGMNNGQFGKVYGGYGEDGKYRFGGNLNYFNGQRRISFIGQSNNVNIQNFATEDLLGVMGSSGRRHGGRSGGPPSGGMGGGPSSGGMRGGGGISDFLVSQQGGISTTHAFGINYQDQWLKAIDVSGSYFFNWSENNNDLELWRDYFTSADPSQTYEETELVNSTNINHRFNLRLSGDLSENDLIRFTPRISIQQNSGASYLAAGNYSGNLATSLLNNIFNSDLETANYSGTLLYRHRFGRRDRALTARITASATAYTGDSDQAAQSITTDDSTTDTTGSSQESQLLQDGTILQASLSYSEPLGENGGLILSYEIGRNGTTSEKETWLPDELSGDYSLLDTLHSNVFSNGLFEQSAEIGYRYRTGGSMLMVRCEYNLSTISNDQTFPSALESDHTWKSIRPAVILRHKFDNTRNLSLVYRSSVRTPTIQQLQAVVDNNNPLQQSTGNPDLKQQTEHRLILNYAASNPDRGTFFLSMLTLNLANDYIGSNTIYASDSTVYQGIPLPAGSRLVVPENLDGYYTFGSFLTYAFPVSPLKSNLNFNLFANYSNTPGLISGVENVSNNFNYGLHLVLASNISERLDFTLTSKSTWYQIGNTLNTNPNSTYSTLNTSGKLEWTIGPGITTHANLEYQTYNGFSVAGENALVLLNMGLGKKLFADDRGEIQFAVYDVLGQNSNISQTTTGNYIEENRTLALTRYYLLSFTYRIRNFNTGN